MGAGNPLIKSFDNDLYDPTTYFIDFSQLYDQKEHEDELSDEEWESQLDRIIEQETQSFQEDFFFNLPKPFEFDEPDESYITELSSAFMGGGIVLAENDDCLILTTDEAVGHHYPFTLIPAFKAEDIAEDWWYENSHKEEWYSARGLDLEERCKEKSIEIYNKKLKKWKKKYEPLMRYVHTFFSDCFSVRTGPWTSLSLKIIGDSYEFL